MDREVALPQLRMLNFGGKIQDVAFALSRLAAPSDTSLTLECTLLDDARHTTDLFRIVSNHLGTSDPILAHDLTLDYGSGLEIWGNMAPESGRLFDLIFKFNGSAEDGDTMERFFAALPQIKVSQMDTSYIALNSSAWQCTLRKPNAAAIHALSFDRSPDPLNDVYTLLCSSATTEESLLPDLQSVTFDRLCAEDMTPARKFAFLASLERRRVLGLPLKEVVFDHCSPLDGEWVDELRKIVPRITVFNDGDYE